MFASATRRSSLLVMAKARTRKRQPQAQMTSRPICKHLKKACMRGGAVAGLSLMKGPIGLGLLQGLWQQRP